MEQEKKWPQPTTPQLTTPHLTIPQLTTPQLTIPPLSVLFPYSVASGLYGLYVSDLLVDVM